MARARDGLGAMKPYDSPQLDVPVRLNTNECPYPLPEGYAEDLAARVRAIPLNRYPDGEAGELLHRLAATVGRPPNEVWAANGSNEVIQQLLLAYGGPGRRALVFEPTYGLHRRLAWITHTDVDTVTLDSPFDVGPAQVAEARRIAPDLVFVCSPNNPTGGARPAETVAELAESGPLVVVDEAYVEFGGESALHLIDSCPNVVVVRTFSKAFALAGARIGYCLGRAEVIENLRKVRLPYHLSALTQAAGLAALDHAGEAMAILDAVREQRDRLLRGLGGMAGVTAYPSDANFVLFRPPGEATAVWRALVDRGVLVRNLSDVVAGCLRVTAGTPHEVWAFLDAMEEVLR